jgi:hypothetical protein
MKQVVLRAYQLARSGKCASLGDIQDHLISEEFHPLRIKENLTEPLGASLTQRCEEVRKSGYLEK